jgi:hypothetical protein
MKIQFLNDSEVIEIQSLKEISKHMDKVLPLISKSTLPYSLNYIKSEILEGRCAITIFDPSPGISFCGGGNIPAYLYGSSSEERPHMVSLLIPATGSFAQIGIAKIVEFDHL